MPDIFPLQTEGHGGKRLRGFLLALACAWLSVGGWLMAHTAMAGETSGFAPPANLTRGINLTNWFRFPPSRDPAALGAYLSNQALAGLRDAGFGFVRLAVDPAIVATAPGRAVLIGAIRRVQRQGFAVVVSPHPQAWRLEADASPLVAFWRTLAPELRALDQTRVVPEILNEPVFPGDPAGWRAVQHAVLQDIRRALPAATVVLTGQDWGSIDGLLALIPEDDGNVVYSFHLYDPPELTSLAAYRPGLDRAALANLPFPVDDPSRCEAAAGGARDPATAGLMRYYCGFGWDSGRIGASLDRAAAWAHRHHAALLAGEFGATVSLNAAARLAWLRTVRDGLETRHIGWALWGYDDVMGFAIQPPPGPRPRLDPDVLSALGLPPRM
nr:cellulase family glycosylhydrolase [uncultured Rhodopila sp.]